MRSGKLSEEYRWTDEQTDRQTDWPTPLITKLREAEKVRVSSGEEAETK